MTRGGRKTSCRPPRVGGEPQAATPDASIGEGRSLIVSYTSAGNDGTAFGVSIIHDDCVA